MTMLTNNKIIIIIQSYDEIPFLCYTLKKYFKKKKIHILNFGSQDLKLHLTNLFRSKNIKNTSYIFEDSMYDSKLLIIKKYFLYFTFLKINFLTKFKNFSKIYFFTPFDAPHLSIFINYFEKKMTFIPLPILIKRKLLDKNGNYIVKNPKNYELNLFRYIKNKLFFGKSLTFKKIGPSICTAIKEDYIQKKINFIKNNNLNFILKATEKNYQSFNYLKNKISLKKKILILFDQHYLQRNLVISAPYFNLINFLKEICEKNNIQFYYKAHPGRVACEKLLKLKNLKIIDSYIPAQFFQKNNIILSSISSGSLVSSFNNLKLSLINLIHFKNKQFGLLAREDLEKKIINKVYAPLTIAELKDLLIKFSKLPKLKNRIFNEYNFIRSQK
jgi:hypothetical protein